MSSLRAFIHQHPALAALLLLWALAIKAVVPAGYMVGPGSIAMVLCDEGRGTAVSKVVSVPMKPGLPGEAPDSDKAGCAFTALGMAMTGNAGPALLALAIAWALVIGLAPVEPARPRRAGQLRPPLRGPPALA